jgi:5-bromo-4-chloroindolyl phosphate hydrolysis protein
MGRRSFEDAEQLGRLATEKLKDLLSDDSLEKRQRWMERERLREERRRRARQAGLGRLIAIGFGLAAGGLASMMLPNVAAVGIGILSGAILLSVLRLMHASMASQAPKPIRIEAPSVKSEGIADSRAETARAVLDRAAEALRETQAKAKAITDPEARAGIERLGASGQRILNAIAERPEFLARAQRVLTYHCERAVFLVGSLAALAQGPSTDAQRYQAIKHVLARMENLFERTALDLVAGDGKEMDLELRLISQALDEDLRP